MAMGGTSVATSQRRSANRPGTDSRSSRAFPGLSRCYVTGHHCANAELLAEGRVGSTCRSFLAKGYDVLFRELCGRVFRSFVVAAEYLNRMLVVLSACTPGEIFKTVIENVSVFVIGFRPMSGRARERGEGQARNCELFPVLFMVPPERYVEVSSFLGRLREDRTLADVVAFDFDAYTTKVGHRVQTFVFGGWDPLLRNLNPIMHGVE